LDKVGGKGHEKRDDKEGVILTGAHFVKAGEGVIDEDIGDSNLRVKDNVKGRGLDVVGEGRDKAGSDGCA
jgi:hypothetical protein